MHKQDFKRSYSAVTLAQLIKRKFTHSHEPMERAQGLMESFVNVCKQRSGKNLLPNEWKTQWMVLYENKIVFFNSEFKEKHKGVIFHYTIRSVLALENRISNMSHWFEIVTKKHTYVLHAVHHRYQTEKLLYSWLVAVHSCLSQGTTDYRDPEAIKKLALQIDNFNHKVTTKKRKIRHEKQKLKKHCRNLTICDSESDVHHTNDVIESPRSNSESAELPFSEQGPLRSCRRVKSRDRTVPGECPVRSRDLVRLNSVRDKRKKKVSEPVQMNVPAHSFSESLVSSDEEIMTVSVEYPNIFRQQSFTSIHRNKILQLSARYNGEESQSPHTNNTVKLSSDPCSIVRLPSANDSPYSDRSDYVGTDAPKLRYTSNDKIIFESDIAKEKLLKEQSDRIISEKHTLRKTQTNDKTMSEKSDTTQETVPKFRPEDKTMSEKSDAVLDRKSRSIDKTMTEKSEKNDPEKQTLRKTRTNDKTMIEKSDTTQETAPKSRNEDKFMPEKQIIRRIRTKDKSMAENSTLTDVKLRTSRKSLADKSTTPDITQKSRMVNNTIPERNTQSDKENIPPKSRTLDKSSISEKSDIDKEKTSNNRTSNKDKGIPDPKSDKMITRTKLQHSIPGLSQREKQRLRSMDKSRSVEKVISKPLHDKLVSTSKVLNRSQSVSSRRRKKSVSSTVEV